jgi:chromosome segregation ATPase
VYNPFAMNEDINRIKGLLDKINTLNFFQRLFGWRKFRNELIGISSNITNLDRDLLSLRLKKEELTAALVQRHNDLVNVQKEKERLETVEIKLSESIGSKESEINRLTREGGGYKEKVQYLEVELKNIQNENIELKKEEAFRTEAYQNNVAALNSLREQIQNERTQEITDRHHEEIKRREELKDTWRLHETELKNRIKACAASIPSNTWTRCRSKESRTIPCSFATSM